jgi:hypothetical protein
VFVVDIDLHEDSETEFEVSGDVCRCRYFNLRRFVDIAPEGTGRPDFFRPNLAPVLFQVGATLNDYDKLDKGRSSPFTILVILPVISNLRRGV